MQTTNNILVVKPAGFCFNSQTEITNAFQIKSIDTKEEIERKVNAEFHLFVDTLLKNNLNVTVVNDTLLPQKPDAIFPNNWVSFHQTGEVIIYPMCTPNRRLEKRLDIINSLQSDFEIKGIIDLSHFEREDKYLEGTGSIVFDHDNKIAYACVSIRTNKEVMEHLCKLINYTPIIFNAYDENGLEIYHTNVMLSIGTKTATICLESIVDINERELVVELLQQTKTLIEISFTQMKAFTGNMLQLKNNNCKELIVLSQTAFKSLTIIQKNEIEKTAELIPIDIPTIENIGGGSIRCMIAEIFCSEK